MSIKLDIRKPQKRVSVLATFAMVWHTVKPFRGPQLIKMSMTDREFKNSTNENIPD